MPGTTLFGGTAWSIGTTGRGAPPGRDWRFPFASRSCFPSRSLSPGPLVFREDFRTMRGRRRRPRIFPKQKGDPPDRLLPLARISPLGELGGERQTVHVLPEL